MEERKGKVDRLAMGPKNKDPEKISPDEVYVIIPEGPGEEITHTIREGGEHEVEMKLSFQKLLEIHLWNLSISEEIPEETRTEAKRIYKILKKYIRDLEIAIDPGWKFRAQFTTVGDISEEEITSIMRNEITQLLTAVIYGKKDEFIRDYDKKFPPPSEKEGKGVKLHKQPRNYLKTMAGIVGRDTSAPSLFSIPDEEPQGITLKETISKKTAILGNYILQLWQKDKNLIDGKKRITNLAPIVKHMETSFSELKIYFLYLGGFTYPFVKEDEDGGITITNEQLFHIEFKYTKETGNKYRQQTGTTLLKFLKDAPVKYIDVKPNLRMIKGLAGENLGNVLVSDNFVKLALDISDIAYKILSYSASNRPAQAIGEDKLIVHLNMKEHLKKRGLPWIRQQIAKGFTELHLKGHIANWNLNEEERIYKFRYTDKFIKHKDFTREQTETAGNPSPKQPKKPHPERKKHP